MTSEYLLKSGRAPTRHGQIFYRTAGEGTTLLLLHATPRSSRSYYQLIPFLTQYHRVIALDTLGFGESDPLPPRAGIGMLAESVADLLNTLGVAPAAVFGLHTGNKIGTALALSYPEMVSCFILCGMTHSIILDRTAREAAIKELVATPFVRSDITENEKLDRRQGAASLDRIYKANYDFDLKAMLDGLEPPTLVLELVTPGESHFGQQANKLAELISDSTLSTFKGSDRDALEKNADALAQIIREFTASHQGSSKPSKL